MSIANTYMYMYISFFKFPGNPGGSWTEDEISITRNRIIEMLRPEPEIVKINFDDWVDDFHMKRVTENTFIRLGFHDCLRYEDGSGGCDGCLSWQGMGWRTPCPGRFMNDDNEDNMENENDEKTNFCPEVPVQEKTDNNGTILHFFLDFPFPAKKF